MKTAFRFFDNSALAYIKVSLHGGLDSLDFYILNIILDSNELSSLINNTLSEKCLGSLDILELLFKKSWKQNYISDLKYCQEE